MSHRPGHRRVLTAFRLHGVRRVRVDGAGDHHHPRTGHPAGGSIGRGLDGVAVYDSESLTEREAAEFDADGALINADKAIGELVNTHGGGFFSGCYNDPNATSERMRGGMFRSGDLGYRDADGSIRPGAPPTGCATTRSSPPAEFEQSSPRNPTCPPRRRGRAGCGSAATCRSPRRTRYSSAN